MNVCAVVAHPDDEILGFGGVLAKHVKAGDSVDILILGEGLTSRDVEVSAEDLRALQDEAKAANMAIGVKKITFSSFPDNQFDTIPLLNIVKEIEEFFAAVEPLVVYTHHWGDLNIDHRICFEAVQTASRPVHSTVRKILVGEILSSSEWSAPEPCRIFYPNVFVDVTGEMDAKLSAMKCYSSEMCQYPHPRSEKGVRILAEKRGLDVGLKYAEAFFLVRDIRV